MAGLGFDTGSIYSTHGPKDLNENQKNNSDFENVTKKWYQFFREFRDDAIYIYRNQLKNNLLVHNYSVTVDLLHVQLSQPDLANDLVKAAQDFVPLVEEAARKLAIEILQQENIPIVNFPDIQALFKSSSNGISMRTISSNLINKLVRISGIVSSASTPTARAVELHIFCRSCRHSKVIRVSKGFSGVQIPRYCENTEAVSDDKKCPIDPYLVDHDKTKYIDQQVLKLQETPDTVPVGELPRHMLLTVDRYLVNKAYPGARVYINGVYDIFQKQGKGSEGFAVRNPYMRVLGMDIEVETARRGKNSFTPEEETKFIELSRRPDLFEVFSRSVAPSIFGNEDIKKSIACLLVGGSKKALPDGMRLRGDINVLLLGDPGTAKSQLLKFVEKVAPISVYTSGKGSSAAGLTASVIRDPTTREFYLEGGAMVLADGGVVCIDEFDKMREEDRVAIHEAMEQQTISIAKAGITTVLNSRTSVLAAANPIFGKYDDMKTPGENIDFQSTILSRFDMIYILKDEHNKERDEALARHIMNVHTTLTSSNVESELDLNLMRGFISYARNRCFPRLMNEAKEKLASHFVEIRSQVKQLEKETNARSSVPITVRQLEAIVRISEAVAKFQLSPHVTEAHVDEAIRLFRVSTYNATRSGHIMGEGMMLSSAKKEILQAQDEIKRRLAVGSRIPERILQEYLKQKQLGDFVIKRALGHLQAQGIIQYSNQGRTITRSGL